MLPGKLPKGGAGQKRAIGRDWKAESLLHILASRQTGWPQAPSTPCPGGNVLGSQDIGTVRAAFVTHLKLHLPVLRGSREQRAAHARRFQLLRLWRNAVLNTSRPSHILSFLFSFLSSIFVFLFPSRPYNNSERCRAALPKPPVVRDQLFPPPNPLQTDPFEKCNKNELLEINEYFKKQRHIKHKPSFLLLDSKDMCQITSKVSETLNSCTYLLANLSQ